MSKLKSITLSNLRKFGTNVTIDLSPGATILIAPNGTGKTTVFEAIEFGLTGKIARLRDEIDHIIRDNQNTASVKLEFSEMSATASVTTAGSVVQDGDLSKIFPNVSSNDVPFLLRLTHLLDQRENGWIVNAEERDAGSHLAKLPIGRDGSKARDTLAAVRRSLAEQRGRTEEVLIGHETNLNEWNQLIQERDIASAGAVGALRPRDRIAGALADVASQTHTSSQIPSGLLSGPVSQDGLAIAHSSLSQILQGQLERANVNISTLPLAVDLVERYVIAKERLESLNTDLASARDALELHTTTAAQSSASLREHQSNIHSARLMLASIEQQLERLIGQAAAKQEIDRRSGALASANANLRHAEDSILVLREQHEKHQRVRNQHAQINTQIQMAMQTEQRLHAARQVLSDWEDTEKRISEITQEISNLEELISKKITELDAERSLHEARKTAESSARSNYEVLSTSDDAIRQSVASIAQHLSPEQDRCPLCLEPHGAHELQSRVDQALKAISPSLTAAERQLRAATESAKVSEIAVDKAQQELDVNRRELGVLMSSRTSLERLVADFRIHPTLASDSLPLARESLKQKFDSIAKAMSALDLQKTALDEPPTPESFETTERAFNSAQHVLDFARAEQSAAATRLDHAAASMAALISEEPLPRPLEQLTGEKAHLEQQIIALNGKVGASQSTLDTLQQQLLLSSTAVKGLEDDVRRTQTLLLQLRAGWRELELTGDPVAEAVQAREASLQSTLTLLMGHLSQLEGIAVEISAWSKLNESQLVQRLIDAQRLDRSEGDFETALKKRISAARSNLTRLNALSEAMDFLDTALKKEIGNVQKHVGKVVPRWQGLLKRVVREPRFHEASLKLFNSYNKDRAGISVPLGNRLVPVPDVASEAQLTDLQLTFLLSMALSHQWSPWKALLLDDPTQHHDLVHASAVFDLLRDYIVDQGFQVVIATHDALQARYFLRKLKNDGIDAKIWTLVPTENGVTAQSGH